MFIAEIAFETRQYKDFLEYLTPLMEKSSNVDVKKSQNVVYLL